MRHGGQIHLLHEPIGDEDVVDQLGTALVDTGVIAPGRHERRHVPQPLSVAPVGRLEPRRVDLRSVSPWSTVCAAGLGYRTRAAPIRPRSLPSDEDARKSDASDGGGAAPLPTTSYRRPPSDADSSAWPPGARRSRGCRSRSAYLAVGGGGHFHGGHASGPTSGESIMVA